MPNTFSPEGQQRAAQMVLKREREPDSQWSAMASITVEIGRSSRSAAFHQRSPRSSTARARGGSEHGGRTHVHSLLQAEAVQIREGVGRLAWLRKQVEETDEGS